MSKKIELTEKEAYWLGVALQIVETDVYGDYEDMEEDDKKLISAIRRISKKLEV